MSIIERLEEHAGGMVVRRIRIGPDGARLAAGGYREAELHVWLPVDGETDEAFDQRVLLEASLLALRRSRIVMLEPTTAAW